MGAELPLLLFFVFSAGSADAGPGSCATLGCGKYKKGSPCQCNSGCEHYGDCCDDYPKVCKHPAPSPSPSKECKYPHGPSAGVEQLHLALGSTPADMTVTFVTSKDWAAVPNCTVEGLGSFQGTSHTYTDDGWLGLIHVVTLKGLTPATAYTYDCGSGRFSLRTAPEVGALPVKVAAMADLGQDSDNVGCGNRTIDRLNSNAAAGAYGMLLHAGDIAYTSGTTCVWDNFMRELEPATARVPYMVAVGNHEHYYNFSAYRARFSMPGEAASNGNLWYSFDFGGVHFAAFSTEHDLDLQVDWLRADLAKAVANRATVPWIVVTAHKPMYCSTDDYYDCVIGRKKVAGAMEGLLHEASVDLFLAGHLHNYERTYPVFNGTVSGTSYSDPSEPVHVVIGMAGDDEGTTDKWEAQPAWRALKDARVGYTMLEFQDAHTMKFEYILSETGEVADTFVLTKSRGSKVIV